MTQRRSHQALAIATCLVLANTASLPLHANLGAQTPEQTPPSKQLPIPWTKDLGAAQSAATTSKNPVLVMFSTTWCPPCQALLKDVLPKSSIATTLEAFHCVYVDGDAHEDLVETHQVEGFPTFLFLDHTGSETRRQVGIDPTESGFLALLEGKPQPVSSTKAESPTAKNAPTGQAEPIALAALESLQNEANHFTGSVEVISSASEGSEMFMIMGDAGVHPEPFSGPLELLTTKTGESLVASTNPMPGAVVFKNSQGVVTRTTAAAGTVLDSTALVDDLCLFLQTKRFVEWANASAAWSRTAEGESLEFSAKVPRNVVESTVQDGADHEFGMVDPMAVHIMYANLTLTTSQDGALQAIGWTLVRNDPMAVMAEVAEESGGEIDFEMIADLPPIAGSRHRYRFERSQDAKPSARLAKTLEEFRAMPR